MNVDILVFLAQGSITLFGFVAVFFIFRYQRIDTYIDNRRPILRGLLKKRIRKNPDILRRVELVGRGDPVGDLAYFRAASKDDELVIFYVREIIKLSEWRGDLKHRGIWTIIYLGVCSFVLLTGRMALHFLGDLIGRSNMVAELTVLSGFGLFSLGLFLTMNFLYRSFGQRFSSHG